MKKKKEHLFSITKKDFKIERTKGSGKGGQNRNKRETAIRITHLESGLSAYCADERSQEQNLRRAFKNLVHNSTFQNWLKVKIAREGFEKVELKKKIDHDVEEWMKPENLKVEYF